MMRPLTNWLRPRITAVIFIRLVRIGVRGKILPLFMNAAPTWHESKEAFPELTGAQLLMALYTSRYVPVPSRGWYPYLMIIWFLLLKTTNRKGNNFFFAT